MRRVRKREYVRPAATVVELRCTTTLLEVSATLEDYGDVEIQDWT